MLDFFDRIIMRNIATTERVTPRPISRFENGRERVLGDAQAEAGVMSAIHDSNQNETRSSDIEHEATESPRENDTLPTGLHAAGLGVVSDVAARDQDVHDSHSDAVQRPVESPTTGPSQHTQHAGHVRVRTALASGSSSTGSHSAQRVEYVRSEASTLSPDQRTPTTGPSSAASSLSGAEAVDGSGGAASLGIRAAGTPLVPPGDHPSDRPGPHPGDNASLGDWIEPDSNEREDGSNKNAAGGPMHARVRSSVLVPRPAAPASTGQEARHGIEQDSPRTINVTIGRIEVRAKVEAAPAPPPGPPPRRTMSLDEYLKQRGEKRS